MSAHIEHKGACRVDSSNRCIVDAPIVPIFYATKQK